MESSRTIVVSDDLEIPEAELTYRYSTSGGPGGQHANRSATRVTVRFDVAHSPSLSEQQRALLLVNLGSRLDDNGVLQVQSQQSRSQHQNRLNALERLRLLLADGLVEEKPREPTKRTAGSERRRIESKRRHGQRKRDRSKRYPDDI
jgi:ribosome-associated protein